MQLKDLAKLANVSVSTASKALKGSKELNDATIEHVLKVAKECGYFVEQKKQRVSSSKQNGKIIIVVPEIISVYYSMLATKLIERFKQLKITSQVYVHDFNTKNQTEIVNESLVTSDVIGAVLLDGSVDREMFADFPIVSRRGKVVLVDNAAVELTMLVDHLRELGHKKIYLFGENHTVSRINKFIKIMNDFGLNADESNCFTSDYRFEKAGYDLANRLVDEGNVPTAIICSYDEIAFGTISALSQRGIKVPEDVSVVGINNVPAAEFYPIPLTTLDKCGDDYCDKIVKTMQKMLENPDYQQEQILQEFKLVIRKSTAKVKS